MDFFEFLNAAVTPYHTVSCLKSHFEANSFKDFSGKIETGKSYFVCRGASIIAFRTPKTWNDASKFRIALAHTDFPTLKISPNPDVASAGVNTLHTEVYGSPPIGKKQVGTAAMATTNAVAAIAQHVIKAID